MGALLQMAFVAPSIKLVGTYKMFVNTFNKIWVQINVTVLFEQLPQKNYTNGDFKCFIIIHVITENRNRRASGPVHLNPTIPLHKNHIIKSFQNYQCLQSKLLVVLSRLTQ